MKIREISDYLLEFQIRVQYTRLIVIAPLFQKKSDAITITMLAI